MTLSSSFLLLPTLYLRMVAAFIPGSNLLFTVLSRWKELKSSAIKGRISK
jgi:hypothetical protein